MKFAQRIPVVVWLILSATALFFLPASAIALVRGVAIDCVRPGLSFSAAARARLSQLQQSWVDSCSQGSHTRIRELEAELRRERQQRLAVVAASALLHEPSGTADPAQLKSAAGRNAERLMMARVEQAALLGEAAVQHWRQRVLVGAGTQQKLHESALVLTSNHPVIDAGEQQGVTSEDPILLGRQVLGKIEHAGRWTSTVLWLTDPAYRGRAQLVRQTSRGPVFGSKGLITGIGDDQCQLLNVSSTESVQVGDLVYTAERDGVFPVPLYYGEVVEASAGPDDREWRIVVKPASRPSAITNVDILRAELNEARLLAN